MSELNRYLMKIEYYSERLNLIKICAGVEHTEELLCCELLIIVPQTVVVLSATDIKKIDINYLTCLSHKYK